MKESLTPREPIKTKKEVTTISEVMHMAPKERVAGLVKLGVLTSLEGYTWGTIPPPGPTRFYVFANLQGFPVPMYKTFQHTDDKRTDTDFFVFFGVDTMNGWIRKGYKDESNSFYGVKDLERISKILTRVFRFDTSRENYVPVGEEIKDNHELNVLLSKRFYRKTADPSLSDLFKRF